MQLHRGKQYACGARNLVDIYQPVRQQDSNSTSPEGGGSMPAVLFVHGGVWASGERWHYTRMAHELAKQGLVVCIMAYTLYPAVRVDAMVRTTRHLCAPCTCRHRCIELTRMVLRQIALCGRAPMQSSDGAWHVALMR